MIDLGGADGANTLGLTDNELDGIFAGILSIGDSFTGRISFVSGIAPAGVNQLELRSGLADIQDNHVGTDVTVARLAMSAGTGIGITGASTGIDTDVALIEARTFSGGMNIGNVGAVVVGGVTSGLAGLSVGDSGDLRLTAGGTIELAETVSGGTSSGNVFLTANGAGADVTGQVDVDAILAPSGSITVAAGQDIRFGASGLSGQDSDVLAKGSITLSAGRDIVLDGSAQVVSDIVNTGSGGSVTATAGRNIDVGGSFAGIIAAGDGGGNVTLTTGVDGVLTVSGIGFNPNVSSQSGDVIVNADRIAIANISTIAAAHSVTLQPVSSAWGVNLGSATDVAAGTLELSDAELDRVFAPTLRVGSTAAAGNLTVSSAITADDYDTLSLRTGGAIIDGAAGIAADITVTNLALRAGAGIGHADFLDVDVSNLAFSNSVIGDVNLPNTFGLTLAAVDGLTASSNAGGAAQVLSGGPLTVATNVTASGFLNLFAQEDASSSDNVTILAGTTVRSTGGTVQLAAGDHVVAQAG